MFNSKTRNIFCIFIILFYITYVRTISDIKKSGVIGNGGNIFCQSDDNEDIYQEPEQNDDNSGDTDQPQPDDLQDDSGDSESE